MKGIDELGEFNRARWNALARARVAYSVPALDLDEASARKLVDDRGVLEPLSGSFLGKGVLCLAASGGQQSAAFALLGAEVTVLDLSDVQLERDHQAAEHYGHRVRLELGDMRDLSRFTDGQFDIVWQAHSINFVPDASVVFSAIARVLVLGGLYRLSFTNPFVHGTWDKSWTGKGYLLAGPYRDGEVVTDDPIWTFTNDRNEQQRIEGPRSFRHTFSTIINGLISARLQILDLSVDGAGDEQAPPGSWKHFEAFAAPWFAATARKGRTA